MKLANEVIDAIRLIPSEYQGWDKTQGPHTYAIHGKDEPQILAAIERVLSAVPETGALTDKQIIATADAASRAYYDLPWEKLNYVARNTWKGVVRAVLSRCPAQPADMKSEARPWLDESRRIKAQYNAAEPSPQQDDEAVVEEMYKAAFNVDEEVCIDGMTAALAIARRGWLPRSEHTFTLLEEVEKAANATWVSCGFKVQWEYFLAKMLARLTAPEKADAAVVVASKRIYALSERIAKAAAKIGAAQTEFEAAKAEFQSYMDKGASK